VVAVFSPDGKTVLTGSRDRTAQRWDAATGRPLGPPLDHSDWVEVVQYARNGEIILTMAGSAVRLWDAGTGAALGRPLPHLGPGLAPALSPDGRTLVTRAADWTVRFWETSTGAPQGEPIPASAAFFSVFTPDSRAVLGTRDTTAQWVEVTTGKPLGKPMYHPNVIRHAILSPDGRILATAALDGMFRLWDATTGDARGQVFRSGLHTGAAFSPDGRLFLTRVGSTATFWQVATGRAIGARPSHAGQILDACFDPDGKTLWTVGWDLKVRRWALPLPVDGTAERIVLWAEVLSGRELDAAGLEHWLDPSAWNERRRRLEEVGGPPRS
jgi:WD40 repeat protein